MDPPNLVNVSSFLEMTISKATFAPSTPCTIHFECMESAPNDSTRVRRLTGIFRRARVKIFILAYGNFWFQLSDFSSNLTGHHETKTAKPIWGCRSKYSNFYFKPRLPMTNEDVLNRLSLPIAMYIIRREGGGCCCVFPSLLFSAQLINCAKLIN